MNNLEVNKIQEDDFGRKSGVLLVNKSKGKTSHDIVDQLRRDLHMRQIGHAGALDPFATGLMILLVGKATKLSDELLGLDKEYIADILFGVSTVSGDIEGEIKEVKFDVFPDENKVKEVLESLQPGYDQFVPIFSSVKVSGDKLRVLARSSDRFEIKDKAEVKIVEFYKNDRVFKTVELPHKYVEIKKIELLNYELKNLDDINGEFRDENIKSYENKKVLIAKVRVSCSKGTYIRQLAEDLGSKLSPTLPSMLIRLERTRIGSYAIEDSIKSI